MAIHFEKKRKIFHLSLKNNYSYYFHVNKYNYLIHLYDGKYLSDISKERVSERYMERYAFLNGNNEEVQDEDYYFSQIASQMEVASFGKGDKRGAHTIVVGDDNIPITNFLYKSYRIIKGLSKKDVSFPHVKFKDNEVETLVVTLKEERREVYLELYFEVSEKYDCLVRYSKLINKEKTPIKVNKFSSLELDLKESDYNIIALKGTWGNETNIEEIPLNHSFTQISENHGARGFYYNPAVALKRKNTTLDNGEVYGFNILYSGDFSYEFKVDEIDQTRLTVSYNSETTKFYLEEGQTLTSFETIQVFTTQGLNKMSQIFHKLILERILPSNIKKQDYILVNSWEAYYFDFDTEKIKKVINKASELGINLVVIDDGWFGKRNGDNSSLGDWEVNLEKIDLEEVVSYGKNKNVDIGLWVEPEMISPDSNLFKEHPDFALFPKDYQNPTLLRHQLILDLTRDDVIDHVFSKLTKIFDKYDIKYVKWDFNRYLTEAYSPSLSKERQEETAYRFTLGSYKLLNKFVKRYPNILLETCASGGGRFDLGVLYYSIQAWGSDEMDISLRANIQYSKNLFYPLRTIGSHVPERGNGTLQDRACLSFFGTFGYELDILKLNQEDEEKVKFFNGLFNQFHHNILDGTYYAIYSPFESNYVSFNVTSKSKKECLVYFMIYRKETTKSRWIRVKGLKKDAYYFNSLTNDIYKGDFYMNVGLNISAPLTPYMSMVFVLKEVDVARATLFRKLKQKDGGKRDKLL